MSDRRYYPIPDGFVGDRVDSVVARMTGLSRSVCARLIEEGAVLVDGVPASKSDRTAAGQVLEVDMPAPVSTEPVPTPADLPILYDDDDIVALCNSRLDVIGDMLDSVYATDRGSTIFLYDQCQSALQ